MSNPRFLAPVRLEPSLRHYAWGGRGRRAFIPGFLGAPRTAALPVAEAWFGAHPAAPAMACLGKEKIPLNRWAPPLPFLVKLLDAAKTLSLQLHPNGADARRGYRRETAAGLSLNHPRRLFKDPFAKPEVIIALSPFELFAGFRPRKEVDAELRMPEWRGLLGPAAIPEMKGLVGRLLGLPARKTAACLSALHRRGGRDARTKAIWTAWSDNGRRADPSLLVLWLMEFFRLAPREGIFLQAGMLHAYVRGTGIEVMGNSDNVLRAGLTVKTVHIPETLRSLDAAARPRFLPAARRRFESPGGEFRFQWLGAASRAKIHGPAICLVLKGRLAVRSSAGGLALGGGKAAYLPAGPVSLAWDRAGAALVVSAPR